MSAVTRHQPPAIITLELTETEAEVLCALLGGIGGLVNRGSTGGAPADVVREIFFGLDAAVPNRRVAYSDFFTGQTRCK